MKGFENLEPQMMAPRVMLLEGVWMACVCKNGPVFGGEVLKKSEFGVYRINECGGF